MMMSFIWYKPKYGCSHMIDQLKFGCSHMIDQPSFGFCHQPMQRWSQEMWNLRRDWLFQTIHQGTYDYNYNIIILTSSSSFFCSSSTSNSCSCSLFGAFPVTSSAYSTFALAVAGVVAGINHIILYDCRYQIYQIYICGCRYHIILYHRYHLVSQDDDNGVMNQRWCYHLTVKMEILIIVKVFCSPTPCSLTPSRPSSPPPPPHRVLLPPPRPYLIF